MKTFHRWFFVGALVALCCASCGKRPSPESGSAVPETTPVAVENSRVHGPNPDATAAPLTPEPSAAPDAAVAAPVPASVAAADAEALRGDRDFADYEAWFKKYDLNLKDPKMLDADPDGDGYSNREEFLANTNPRDPNSRPGLHATLRMAGYHETEVPVMLESVSDGKAVIRRTDKESGAKTQTLSVGDKVAGLPMKVAKVVSKTDTDKEGQAIDISRITLQNTETGEKVTLIKDMPARSSASYAEIAPINGGEPKKVHQGEQFVMPGEPGRTYQVLDIRPTQVVVKELGPDTVWTIPKR